MKYVGGLSPEMEDLTDAKKRQNILDFADYYFQSIITKRPVFKAFSPLLETSSEYHPEKLAAVSKSQSKKVVLLTDIQEQPSNLGRMIEAFKTIAPFDVDVLNLNDVEIKGGCLGCLHCGYDNVCAYKDEVKSFIQDQLKPADAVILAGEMQDRYLSSRWKLFFDRSFVFGHTPVLHQKQIGVLISGPLRQNSNLRQILEGYVQLQESNLVGIVTDEDSSEEITQNLKTLADKTSWALEHHIITNENYLSFGVNLLFQQFVPRARGIFHADHLYYKKHGLYQKHKKSQNLVFNTILGIGNHFAGFRREFNKKIKAGMIAGLQKIVNHQ
jgi:multimeric flavodoxin WrbA